MQNIKSAYKPIHYSKTTINELILVYQNFFNEEKDMQSKFTRRTMEKILKQETGFMDKLMWVIEARPNVKAYLEYIIDFDIDTEDLKVTKEPKTA